MADIPGIDNPMYRVLLARTNSEPHWYRIEYADHLLLHAYTRSSTRYSAPILTAIAFSNWWEGRDSKAHQFLQLPLEAEPGYHRARLNNLMICSGSVAMSCGSPAFLRTGIRAEIPDRPPPWFDLKNNPHIMSSGAPATMKW